ncbi:MAG: GtrA family protein [Planctomycetes bacterium]|nr:GtrA family protein [Planctomycetota bacterium]
MRSRQRGDSKLDTLVMWEYVLLLLDKSIGRYVPVRFLMFIIVGLFGACFHLTALGLMLFSFQCAFGTAQAGATAIAMTSNFFLNNLFTHRDNRRKGWRAVRGLLMFYLSCSIGAFVNVKVASSLYLLSVPWWGAGILGAMISAVWNFSLTAATIWSPRTRTPRGRTAGQ